jgi:hypothetical protein
VIVLAHEFRFSIAELGELDADDLRQWIGRVNRLRQMEREAGKRGG